MKVQDFSFDDEYIDTFFYDIINKKIALRFSGYYNNVQQSYYEVNCLFVIEGWKKAKSRKQNETKFHDLDVHMGIFALILSMEFKDKTLELLVLTLDGRYIELYFDEPNINFTFD